MSTEALQTAERRLEEATQRRDAAHARVLEVLEQPGEVSEAAWAEADAAMDEVEYAYEARQGLRARRRGLELGAWDTTQLPPSPDLLGPDALLRRQKLTSRQEQRKDDLRFLRDLIERVNDAKPEVVSEGEYLRASNITCALWKENERTAAAAPSVTFVVGQRMLERLSDRQQTLERILGQGWPAARALMSRQLREAAAAAAAASVAGLAAAKAVEAGSAAAKAATVAAAAAAAAASVTFVVARHLDLLDLTPPPPPPADVE
jgi:hypothetical protein